MDNKEKMNLFFNQIKEVGFGIADIKYEKEYYGLHNIEEFSLCNFRIRGLTGWKFGVWLYGSHRKRMVGVLYAYYPIFDFIPRPSDCYYCIELDSDNPSDFNKRLNDALDEIERNKYVAIYRSLRNDDSSYVEPFMAEIYVRKLRIKQKFVKFYLEVCRLLGIIYGG